MNIMSTIARCPMKKTIMALGIAAAAAGAVALPKAVKCENDPQYRIEVDESIFAKTLTPEKQKEFDAAVTDRLTGNPFNDDLVRLLYTSTIPDSCYVLNKDRMKSYRAPESYRDVDLTGGTYGLGDNISAIGSNMVTACENGYKHVANAADKVEYSINTNPYASGGLVLSGLGLATLMAAARRKAGEEAPAEQKTTETTK